MKLTIDIPDDVTIGDLQAAQGAIFNASTTYVDWDALHNDESGAIGKPGIILLSLARELERASS